MGVATTINGANERCKEIIDKLGINLYYRIRTNDESYPLTKSGKRDVKKLIAEGLTRDCFKPKCENGEIKLDYYNPVQKVLKR